MTPGETAAQPPSLSRLKVPKAPDLLADELRERILSGAFVDGAGLPSERELMAQTGLSRSTVREAMRILEVQDLVRIRAGRTGGAFAQRPGEDAMAKTVDHIIRGRQIGVGSLLQTREALGPYCAELAAKKRTGVHLAELDAALASFHRADGDPGRMLESVFDWHVAVARASSNKLLSGVMSALERAVHEAVTAGGRNNPELGTQAAKVHAAITEAIRTRNAPLAASLMREHVADLAR